MPRDNKPDIDRLKKMAQARRAQHDEDNDDRPFWYSTKGETGLGPLHRDGWTSWVPGGLPPGVEDLED